VSSDEPERSLEDITSIMLALMRIEAKLDELLEEDDGEEEEESTRSSPEARGS
jgi:hypothetical protein